MEIANILAQRELVTSNKKLLTRRLVTSNELSSLEIKKRALIIAEGLTSTEHPNDMTAWYCKAYRLLGNDRYEEIAKFARGGNNPKRLFGATLKKEMMRA